MANNESSGRKPIIETNVPIESVLVRFWGRKVSAWDLQVCKSLGWVESYTRGTETRWRAIDAVAKFGSQIYTRNKVTKFLCDDDLEEWTCSNALVSLDPYFANDIKRLNLRLLLTLVYLCLNGYANYIASDGLIRFSATRSLESLESLDDSDDELLLDLAREGRILGVLHEGAMRWSLTAKGLWFDQIDEPDDPGLGTVRIRLEEEGLLSRQPDENGVVRWLPTEEGFRRGVDSSTKLLKDLLIEIGLGKLLPH